MSKKSANSKPIYEHLVETHGFSPAHKLIISLMPQEQEILEVGSSSGYLTTEFNQKKCQVDVVELDEDALKKVKKVAREVFSGSIEDMNLQKKITKNYNVVVCADVLEHLTDPEPVIDFLKSKLRKEGFFLISIPNVAFWNMRKQLLFKGDFSYQDSGLLDRTHLRFYSVNNFTELLKKHQLKNIELFPAEARIPFEYSIRRIPVLGKIFLKLFKSKIVDSFPNLTFYHYVIKAQI